MSARFFWKEKTEWRAIGLETWEVGKELLMGSPYSVLEPRLAAVLGDRLCTVEVSRQLDQQTPALLLGKDIGGSTFLWKESGTCFC